MNIKELEEVAKYKPDIQLWRGDCLKLMKDIPDKSIDMILCDLPYEQTARNEWDVRINLTNLWCEYTRIIKDSGAIVLFGNGLFTAELMLSNARLWRYNLVWQKTQPTGFYNAKKMPLRSHEDIIIFYKKLPTYNPQKTYGHVRKISTAEHKRNSKFSLNYSKGKPTTYDSTERYPKSVITFSKDTQKSALHSTQKPVALLEYLIKTYTNEGDVVLDNCMGSGSTGVACVNTGRDFIGIELDKGYFEIAQNRIKETQKGTKNEH